MSDAGNVRHVLRAAIERNYHWPTHVRGFSSRIVVHEEGGEWEGDIYAPSSQSIRVALPGASPELMQWVETEVRSIIGHRLYRTFEQGDGRYELSFGDDVLHPAGQTIVVHGDPRSSRYRVKDGLLREAYRHVGARYFILSVQGVQHLDQKTIAKHYSVIHFDAVTQALLRSDIYHDEYTSIEQIWLPRFRNVLSAVDGRLIQRAIRFEQLSVIYEGETTRPEVQPEQHEQLRVKRL